MKFKSYIIFFLLFGVLADVWICAVILRGAHPAWFAGICLPTAVLLGCLPLIASGVQYTRAVCTFSYLTFIFALPKFVLALFSLLGRKVFGIAAPLADGIALAAGCAVSLLFLTLIFFVTRRLGVTRTTLSLRGLPEGFDGICICQLSDFHLGSFGKRSRYIRRIVDRTLALSPELILFTGDLVNFESSEADGYLDELARLQAPLGIYAIRGNHDYLLHGPHSGEARVRDTERLLEIERGLGWHVLCNAHALVRRQGETIAVAGVENISANPYFPQTGGDLSRALEGIPPGCFTLLLSHDPSHWRSEVVPRGHVPLTLSGHTHGLRYKLAGLHVSHWKLHESGGLYVEGEQMLYVAAGLGSAFAFRLGGFPKIELITLKKR